MLTKPILQQNPPRRTCVLLKKIGHALDFSKALQKTKLDITARSALIFVGSILYNTETYN